MLRNMVFRSNIQNMSNITFMQKYNISLVLTKRPKYKDIFYDKDGKFKFDHNKIFHPFTVSMICYKKEELIHDIPKKISDIYYDQSLSDNTRKSALVIYNQFKKIDFDKCDDLIPSSYHSDKNASLFSMYHIVMPSTLAILNSFMHLVNHKLSIGSFLEPFIIANIISLPYRAFVKDIRSEPIIKDNNSRNYIIDEKEHWNMVTSKKPILSKIDLDINDNNLLMSYMYEYLMYIIEFNKDGEKNVNKRLSPINHIYQKLEDELSTYKQNKK